MPYELEAMSIARVGESVRYEPAVSICIVRLAEVRPAAVAIEAFLFLVVIVALSVCCLRCSMRGMKISVTFESIGTQTVRDKDEIMESTIDTIRTQMRKRGLRADGCKEQLASRLHEALLREARVS